MAEAIEYEEFEAAHDGGETPGEHAPGSGAAPPGNGAPANGAGGRDIRRLSEIPIELSVEIGRTRTTVGETLGLRVGSVVALGRQAGDPVELLVNGSPIARGEVVVVDERYGLRITEISEGASEHPLAAARAEASAENGAPAAGAET